MKTSIQIFQWLPRIICIMAIIFISMFAMDSFGPNLTLWQQTVTFILHLIPSFVLLAILLLAWKWELTGGILLAVIGLVATPFVFNLNFNRNHSIAISLEIILMITFPFILAGLLFMASHYIKKRKDHLINSKHLMHS